MISNNAKRRNDDPTEKQIALLKKMGMPNPERLTKGQASALMSKIFSEKKHEMVNKVWAKKK